jgi:hypothetical protein
MVVKENKYLMITLKAFLLKVRIHPVMELKPIIGFLDGVFVYQVVLTKTFMLSNRFIKIYSACK